MRNRRKKSGLRKVNRKIFIVCEGDKTEPNYLNQFIRECTFPGKAVDIVEIVKVRKNTAKELITEAKDLREIPEDEVWAVFDKDGYTKHGEAFDLALGKKVNIAFSSISFEFWILLHFKYTTRSFRKADDVINYLKEQNYIIDYEKSDKIIYNKIKDKTEKAITHAGRIRTHQVTANPACKIYDLNPYTNVDELLKAIKNLEEEYA